MVQDLEKNLKSLYNSWCMDHCVQTSALLQVCPQGLYDISNFFLSFLYQTRLKILLSLRNFIVFEFPLFLPRICFSMFGVELSKNLSLNLARLAQTVNRCFTKLKFRHGLTFHQIAACQ